MTQIAHARPTCQKCSTGMVLSVILPCAEGYDIWSYICSGCGGTFDMVEARTGHHALMIEQRGVRRHRVTTAGTIRFNGAAATCMVKNFSAAGAGLDTTGGVEIPAGFTLTTHGSKLPCHVVWRGKKRIGVAFDGSSIGGGLLAI